MNIEDLDALLESASAPTADVPVCLRGDLRARWESLSAEIAEAKGTDTLGGSTETQELVEELEALEEEMRGATVDFKVRGLGRKVWKKLESEHPVREDSDVDRFYGFNVDTIFEDAIPACLVSPEIPKAKLQALFEKLTAGQFEKLSMAVLNLNRQDVDVPFSRSASQSTRGTGKTSKRRRA